MKYALPLALLLLVPAPAVPQQDGDKNQLAPSEVNAKTDRAIEKACDWLARKQSKMGYIPCSVPVATTSMACLAWMASGSTPHRGPYSKNIRLGIEYLRKACSKSGFFVCSGSSGMYGQGFATQAVAEALGMMHEGDEFDDTQEVLRRAVSLLQRAQNRFGGWNGSPDGNLTDDGSGAVGIMQITALRAARNAGLSIDKETIRRAKKYVLDMTSSQGWYAYNWGSRGSNSPSAARTGAGMYMIGAMGLYENKKYEKGIQNLVKMKPFNKGGSWYYYTAFYSSLAIFQHGGKEWKEWYPKMRDALLKKQNKDGSWPDSYGGLWTAFGAMTLELPLRYLPLFQEGGRGADGH